MVCGQSFNPNTLPSKTQQCYENSPILWLEADEHVTCTLRSCLMPGLEVCATEELEEFPIGNVCMENHNSQHFCTTLHEQYELYTVHRLSPVLVHAGAGMHSQGVSWGKWPFSTTRQCGRAGGQQSGWWSPDISCSPLPQLSPAPRLSSLLPTQPLGLGNTEGRMSCSREPWGSACSQETVKGTSWL